MEGHVMGSWSLTPVSNGSGGRQTRVFDPEVLRSVCGDNPEIINRLLGRFAQFLERDVRELDSAIVRRSIVDVRHQAHRILGSALSVGAQELAAAIEQVGIAARNKDWDAVTAEFQELQDAVSRLRTMLPQS